MCHVPMPRACVTNTPCPDPTHLPRLTLRDAATHCLKPQGLDKSGALAGEMTTSQVTTAVNKGLAKGKKGCMRLVQLAVILRQRLHPAWMSAVKATVVRCNRSLHPAPGTQPLFAPDLRHAAGHALG